MLTTILIVILILALVGALPTWGYSRNWGYGPGGMVGVVLVVLLVLALTGRVSVRRVQLSQYTSAQPQRLGQCVSDHRRPCSKRIGLVNAVRRPTASHRSARTSRPR